MSAGRIVWSTFPSQFDAVWCSLSHFLKLWKFMRNTCWNKYFTIFYLTRLAWPGERGCTFCRAIPPSNVLCKRSLGSERSWGGGGADHHQRRPNHGYKLFLGQVTWRWTDRPFWRAQDWQVSYLVWSSQLSYSSPDRCRSDSCPARSDCRTWADRPPACSLSGSCNPGNSPWGFSVSPCHICIELFVRFRPSE